MRVTEGVHWVIICTPEFERTVAFFRDVMGLQSWRHCQDIADDYTDEYYEAL